MTANGRNHHLRQRRRSDRDLPQGIKAPPLQPIRPNFTVGDNMTTLNELLADQKRLEGLVIWLENKDRLGYDGVNALGMARAELWAVKEQIAKEEGVA